VLLERFNPRSEAAPLRVRFSASGHKFGTPRDMETAVRCAATYRILFLLTGLRALTGSDRRVIKYLNSHPKLPRLCGASVILLDYLLPQYQHEGKSYLTVGIGCTGGASSFVMIANELAKRLRRMGSTRTRLHRDVRKSAPAKK